MDLWTVPHTQLVIGYTCLWWTYPPPYHWAAPWVWPSPRRLSRQEILLEYFGRQVIIWNNVKRYHYPVNLVSNMIYGEHS